MRAGGSRGGEVAGGNDRDDDVIPLLLGTVLCLHICGGVGVFVRFSVCMRAHACVHV